MKKFVPLIRIISVEHDKTLTAEERIRAAMARHKLTYPVKNVFCHLEASRCGVSAGRVAIEVEGGIIWSGHTVTEELADKFCVGLAAFVQKKAVEYGMEL